MVPIWTGNVSEYPSYPFFYGCGDLLLRSFPFPVLFRIACQPAISRKRKIKSERKSRHFQTGHAKQIEKKNRKGANHCIIILERNIHTFLIFRKQFWVLLFEGVAAFFKKALLWKRVTGNSQKNSVHATAVHTLYNGPCHP